MPTLVSLSVLPALSEFALHALTLCCLALKHLGLLSPPSRLTLVIVLDSGHLPSPFSHNIASLPTVSAFLERLKLVGPLLPESCGFG